LFGVLFLGNATLYDLSQIVSCCCKRQTWIKSLPQWTFYLLIIFLPLTHQNEHIAFFGQMQETDFKYDSASEMTNCLAHIYQVLTWNSVWRRLMGP